MQMSTSVQRATEVVTQRLLAQTLTGVSRVHANRDTPEMELAVQVLISDTNLY